MKQIYSIVSIFILSILNISAQTTDVISGLGGLEGMVLKGNDLYISEDDANKISKIDITDPTPTTVDIVTELNIPIGIMLNGNELYICELGANKVSKINITDAVPKTTDVVTGLSKPYKTILHGNDLYIIEYSANKISKIDITDALPTPIDVVTGLDKPLEMLLDGDDLYIAEYGANKVTKINITAPLPTTTTDVITGIDSPAGLTLKNNDLYISSYDAGVISKIDILDEAPTAKEVVSGLNTPAVTIFIGNDFYITQCQASIISLYTLPCSSTVNTISVSRCNSYTVPSMDETYATAGTYTVMDTISTVGGCDSVITINLTINKVDATVTEEGSLLSANDSDAMYQWIDCSNNTAIDEETNKTYTATVDGSYKVALTANGCIDTSACYTITTVGIIDNNFGNKLVLYPNPTNGNFSIDLGVNYQNVKITITDLTGIIIRSTTYNNSRLLNLKLDEPAGIYFLGIESGNKKAVIRLIKE